MTRRQRVLIGAALAVVVGAGTATGLALTGGPPPLSAACAKAKATQDEYVAWAVDQGYPDGMTIAQAMTVQATDLGLLNDMTKAHCPPDTLIHTLPDGS